MIDLPAIQAAIARAGLDGWLLYDFRGQNVLACRVVKLPADKFLSRRWMYFIPASGVPRKLVHRIEPHALDHLPGTATAYNTWQLFEQGVAHLLSGAKRVAMEYVPRNAIPYVSRVDAGTVELVKSCGADVVSSGDLIQEFEAVWDDDQWSMHQQAAVVTDTAFGVAFGFIAERLKAVGHVHELDVQARILAHFREHNLVTYHAPNVSVGPHSGDPHYEPTAGDAGLIRPDNFVLIDLWGKLDRPRSVYSDLTRVGFTGSDVPSRYEEIFRIVARARDTAIERVKSAYASGAELRGWQVDRAARQVIDDAGYGAEFVHRTGHSIGEEVHGNGANMDDFETREERRVMPRTAFSIEPGIYFPEFGIRSEVNVFVDAAGTVHVTGGALQTRVLPIS